MVLSLKTRESKSLPGLQGRQKSYIRNYSFVLSKTSRLREVFFVYEAEILSFIKGALEGKAACDRGEATPFEFRTQ